MLGSALGLVGDGVVPRGDRRVTLGDRVGEGVREGWRAYGRARLEMAERDLGALITVSELRLSLLSDGG